MDREKIETYIQNYLDNFTPYKKGAWCYEDGIILSGVWYLYQVTAKQSYFDFIDSYLEKAVHENGGLTGYVRENYNIDNINAGKVLFDMYSQTGKLKFRKAAKLLFSQLKEHPRTKQGNFWHKKRYPNQVWLDGLYMAQPFYARYIKEFDCSDFPDSPDSSHSSDSRYYRDILNQFKNVRAFLFDEEKKLYCHGYDETRSMMWAHKKTGKSPNIWSRSVGWFAMALVDVLEIAGFEKMLKNLLADYLNELCEGMLTHRSPEGMWFQVVDRPEYEGNYPETSGTLMMAYTFLKAVRLGYLDKKFQKPGEQAFEGTINTYFSEKKGTVHLGGICEVAGLDNKGRDGSISYYLGEKVALDEAKGVAPFLMAYSEMIGKAGF